MHYLTKLTLTALLAAAVCAPASAQRLYKWVDENGNIYYSDQVPPDHNDAAREELNDDGIVIDRTEEAISEEEVAAIRAQQELEAELARQRRKQALEDSQLLSSYAGEDDILRRRDQQIETMDRAIRTTQAFIDGQGKTLAGLMARAARAENSGQPVSEALRETINDTQKQIEDHQASIDRREVEKERIMEEYADELARYREIVERTGGSVSLAPASEDQ